MAEEDERVVGISGFEDVEVEATGRCTINVVLAHAWGKR